MDTRNGIVIIKSKSSITKYLTYLNNNSNEYYKLIKDIQITAKLNGEEVIIRKATKQEKANQSYPFESLFTIKDKLEAKYSSENE